MAKGIVIQNLPLEQLKPYPNNARDNAAAVDAVKQSIVDFGFLIPIVVDKDNVIVAGHTRVTAMKQLRKEFPDDERFMAVPSVIASDLNEEAVDAFRLIDNKTSQLASWDFDKLSVEVSRLVDVGIKFTNFGWTQEEIDCLSNVVNADCLTEMDGVTEAVNQGRSLALHRDGQSVRISIADLSFYVLREDYDKWADDKRREHGYDLDKMLDWLAEQMGLLEAKKRRVALIEAGTASEDGEEVFDEEAEDADA